MAKTNPNSKVQITSKIPPRLKSRLEDYADDKSISISAAIYRLIEEALDQEELKEALKMEIRINREECRQLSAMLVANLHRTSEVAENDIPKMIRGSVAYAHEVIQESEE